MCVFSETCLEIWSEEFWEYDELFYICKDLIEIAEFAILYIYHL